MSQTAVILCRKEKIGNSEKEPLLGFVEAIEDCLVKTAIRNYMPMQMGDVPATWADASLPQTLIGFQPRTHFRNGISHFVAWYREYRGK